MSNLKQSVYIKKESSLAPEIAFKAAFVPNRVILPLSQHAGKPSRILVKESQTVKAGEKIAELDGCVSANLHASISGVVTKIDRHFHPVINLSRAVFISAQGPDGDWPQKKDSEINNISPADLVDIIKEAGIVGLGGAAFPTQVKLSPPPDKKIETLIINGCECEPYLASDDLLMQNNYFQVLKGIEILDKILNPKRIIIAVESNKQLAIERMRQAVIGRRIEVVKLDVKYPQGAEKQLVDSLLSRQVPPGGLPYDVGALVQNVATCFAIYEAR
ncbi:MAG: RnfABCDGE type electron transport complex subunit C, partial [Candidatus Omnitrophica bacterium]|nr:RnfABCDGE type electron transport complex subunit C [Candidatus Omnitrophota bacterium]